MILWNKKSVLKCFKCYSEKRLHNFGNKLEIGTTIIKADICISALGKQKKVHCTFQLQRNSIHNQD